MSANSQSIHTSPKEGENSPLFVIAHLRLKKLQAICSDRKNLVIMFTFKFNELNEYFSLMNNLNDSMILK